MSDKKMQSESVGEYLVSKNGAKYLKLGAKPNASAATKAKVERLIEANGGEIIFVNLYSQDFREKYSIPEFAKGRIESPVSEAKEEAPALKAKAAAQPPPKAKAKAVTADDDDNIDF